MPLRILLRLAHLYHFCLGCAAIIAQNDRTGYLANNEQLVQKLAESYPVRRAAQLTAYFFHRGKAIGEEAKERIEESGIPNQLRDEARHAGRQVTHKATAFKDTFSRELREGLRKMNEDIERQKRQK